MKASVHGLEVSHKNQIHEYPTHFITRVTRRVASVSLAGARGRDRFLFSRCEVLPLLASLARADETTYARILKERDSILSQIVAHREDQLAIGTTGDEALVAARLELWSFRRDTTHSKAKKIKQQKLIVEVFEKKLVAVKGRVTVGIAGHEEILLATDALLQAQQLLEELRLDAKMG